MATTPSEPGPRVPEGYQPGDYIPFKDRDPDNPSSVAGQWADPARQAQQGGAMTHEERYRAIYGTDAPMPVSFASWGRRVLGYLVDTFLGAVFGIPLGIGYWMLHDELDYTTDAAGNRVLSGHTDVSALTIALLVVGGVISLAFTIWNVLIRQGRTGYSLGKSAVGIRLVDAAAGEPVGAGICLLRQLAHIVDSLFCYLGWLWPLWDPRRQTLGDKIVGTVVVIQPEDELRD
jgi:uncharacterized RDD family membrane protein YckC